MFAQRIVASLKRPFGRVYAEQSRSAQGRSKRNRAQTVDVVAEQVKKMLQTADQQLILMVRS